jgi:hypothetical protein
MFGEVWVEWFCIGFAFCDGEEWRDFCYTETE